MSKRRVDPVAPRDIGALAGNFSQENSSMRIRFGQVVSVEAFTCTITIAGSTTQVSGVKFLSRPQAGLGCILMTDGADMFVLGQLSVPATSAIAATAVRTTAQTAGHNVSTTISFESATVNPYSLWSIAAPTLITIATAGKYVATAGLNTAGSTSPAGYRWFRIERSGTIVASHRAQTTVTANQPFVATIVSPVMDCTVGQTFSASIFQTQGAGIACDPATSPVFLSVYYVGP